MAGIQISNDPSGHIIVSFPHDPLLVEKVNQAVALEGGLGVPATPYPAVHNCWIYQAVFYYALYNGWVKTIDAHRWHPDKKHWSFHKLDHPPSHRWGREAEGVEKSESELSPPHGKTTEIHAQGSTQSIGKIRSSSDSLNLKEGVISDNIC